MQCAHGVCALKSSSYNVLLAAMIHMHNLYVGDGMSYKQYSMHYIVPRLGTLVFQSVQYLYEVITNKSQKYIGMEAKNY